jgi:hypothetical protein
LAPVAFFVPFGQVMLAIVPPDWTLAESLRVMAIAGVSVHDISMFARRVVLVFVYQFY